MVRYLGQAWTIPGDYETYKDRMGLFAIGQKATVNQEVVLLYYDKFGGTMDFKERETMGEIILPLYQELVAAGTYPPFEYHEGKRTGIYPTESSKLCRAIEAETGFKYLFVWNYLACLEALAKSGIIDYKHYDPKKEDLKTITEPHIWDEITERIPSILEAAPAAAKGALQFQQNMALLAGIALGGYLLYTANKVIKRR